MDSPRKSSRTSKLVQAAALAAVLVPLGSVAVETSPITHTYSGAGFSQPATNNLLFDFGPYEFRLFFENLANLAIFPVTVDNQITNQGLVASRLTGPGLGGNVCVPIDPSIPGDPCVDFFVTAPGPNGPNDPGPDTWTGFFDITISWDANTDPTFPNNPGNRIRILHNRGDVSGNGFDTDITTEGSYFNGFDPAIGGRDDNFQSFIATQRGNASDVVPEPATLFLAATGVSGLLYRRRRKKQDSAGRKA
jgi:hypothetical protein